MQKSSGDVCSAHSAECILNNVNKFTHFNLFYSKDGYLFDKEAILQYIISKKTEYARRLKEYERQKNVEDNETAELDALEEQKKILKFLNTEKNIVTSTVTKNGNLKRSLLDYPTLPNSD